MTDSLDILSKISNVHKMSEFFFCSEFLLWQWKYDQWLQGISKRITKNVCSLASLQQMPWISKQYIRCLEEFEVWKRVSQTLLEGFRDCNQKY